MSRRYPIAVNAATMLSEFVSGLDRRTLNALVHAVRRDQARIMFIARRTQAAQDATICLGILTLYRAGQAIEGMERIRQALAPLLDEPEQAVLDDLVRANLAALLDLQARAQQEICAWFYGKGERA